MESAALQPQALRLDSVELKFVVPKRTNDWRKLTTSIFALLALFVCTQAHAALFCVSNATGLRNAISAVSGASGAGSNEIRIQGGIYDVSIGASGAYALSLTLNATPLTISGGWNSGCTQRFLNGDATLVVGNSSVRVMSVIALANSNAELNIDGLTFGNGITSSSDMASCLRIETDINAGADINIDRTGFTNCRVSAGGSGPALDVISRSGTVRVRGSVVVNNASPLGAVTLRSLGGGSIYFNGNTVAHNDDAGAAGGPVGVQIDQPTTGGNIWLSNNILWGNGSAGASDLFVGLNAVVFMNSNIVGTFGGDLGDVVQQNTLTANPGFNSTNGVGLSASSIARNSGAAVVVGGNAALDFSGERRTQGSRIDRGAYEFSELFANGFE